MKKPEKKSWEMHNRRDIKNEEKIDNKKVVFDRYKQCHSFFLYCHRSVCLFLHRKQEIVTPAATSKPNSKGKAEK